MSQEMSQDRTERKIKVPGPDHPIALAPAGKRYRVIFRGETVAESDEALAMDETTYPQVLYFPRKHVRMELLQPSERRTYCPYKGEANYFTLAVGADVAEDAVWSYEAAFPAVAPIGGMLAFYASKVDAIEEA